MYRKLQNPNPNGIPYTLLPEPQPPKHIPGTPNPISESPSPLLYLPYPIPHTPHPLRVNRETPNPMTQAICPKP